VLTDVFAKIVAWLSYQIRFVKVGAKRGNPLFVGIGSTKLFLLSVVILALFPQKSESEWSWRIWSFLISPPNEIGDTLAGIAGALAFLWIIVTVMLQSKELAAQREELKLTRAEFSLMNEVQSKQSFDRFFFELVQTHNQKVNVIRPNSRPVSVQTGANTISKTVRSGRSSFGTFFRL
jgi:hypothetical protein